MVPQHLPLKMMSTTPAHLKGCIMEQISKFPPTLESLWILGLPSYKCANSHSLRGLIGGNCVQCPHSAQFIGQHWGILE